MDNHSTNFLIHLLHKLCLVLIIFSLSLFEISHSVSIYKLNNPIQLSSAFAEGDSHDPWQGENRQQSANYTKNLDGEKRKECEGEENSKDDDCIDEASFDLGKNIGERVLSTILMILFSVVAIGAAVSCFNGVRKGMMNNACSISAIPLAIGGVSFIVGEIIFYVQTKNNLMGSIQYNQADLDQWSEFCTQYNGYDDRATALAALDGGELNQYKPGDVDDEVFGITGTETTEGENGEETTTQVDRPFEVYCDQVAIVQTQVDSLQNLSDSLKTKRGFYYTAGGSIALGSIWEIGQLIHFAGAGPQKDSALAQLMAEIKTISKEKKAAFAKLKGQINKRIAVATPPNTGTAPNPEHVNLPKYKIDLKNAIAMNTACVEKIGRCYAFMDETYRFHRVYGQKKQASEGNGTPEDSSGLMCLADYTEFNMPNAWRMGCFEVIAACDSAVIAPLTPGGSSIFDSDIRGLVSDVGPRLVRPFIAKETSEDVYENFAAGGCSLGDTSSLEGLQESLFDEIKGKGLASNYETSLFEFVRDKDTIGLQTAIENVTQAEGITSVNKDIITQNLQQLINIQNLLNIRSEGSTSLSQITEAVYTNYQKILADNRLTDACFQSCINGIKKPGGNASFKMPDSIDEFQLKENDKFYAEVQKVIDQVFPKVLASQENYSKGDIGANVSWWSLLTIAPILSAIWPLGSTIMRFYYQAPQHRLIWISLVVGIGIWYLFHLNDTITQVDEALEKARGMIDGLAAAVAIEVNISASTTGVTQQVGSDFESSAKVEYPDQNLGIKTPCPAGGDGRGGCKKVGTSLKATLKALEINGLAGISNSLEEFTDGISGKDTISGSTLQAQGNLNNALSKLDNIRDRLMKKYNAQRSKLGQKPFDPKPAADSLMKGLRTAIANSKNPAVQAALKGDLIASAKPELDENEKSLLDKLKAKKKGGVEEKGKKEDFMSGLKFDFKADEQNAGMDFDLEEEAQRVSDLNVDMDDITKSKGTNIFQVISTRYLKSAYPRLLEEDK